MNKQIEEILQTLSNKFGTTVEHLWEVLIRQAKILGWCNLGICVALFLFCFISLYLWYKFKEKRKDNYDEDFFIIPMVIGLLWFCVIIGTAITFSDNLSMILNPEYWALKQIIK